MPDYLLLNPHDSRDSKGRARRTFEVQTEDGCELPNITLVGDADDSFWRVNGQQVATRLVGRAIARGGTIL